MGARFVFPAVSLEGKAFWLIRSAPVTLESYLWSKFWAALIPLLVVAEILVLVTNTFLEVDRFTMVLSVASIFMITLGVTSLGVGIGALYPRFNVANPATISTGFGGIVYMIVTLLYIGVVVLAVAYPAYLYLEAQFRNTPLPGAFWSGAAVALLFLIVVNGLAVRLPIRLGAKSLAEM